MHGSDFETVLLFRTYETNEETISLYSVHPMLLKPKQMGILKLVNIELNVTSKWEEDICHILKDGTTMRRFDIDLISEASH